VSPAVPTMQFAAGTVHPVTDHEVPRAGVALLISVFHHEFFNSIIDKHQHMHFFTFKTVLV